MANSFFKASLSSLNTIRVFLFTNMPQRNKYVFTFYSPKTSYKPEIIKITSQQTFTIVDLKLKENIEFGYGYQLSLNDFGITEVDVSDAVNFPEFDEMFNYDEDDLGATYTKEETTFAIWAPLAIAVVLELENEDSSFAGHFLTRTDKGVFRLTVKGDLLNRKYAYHINNSGITRKCNDPYGKGTSLDSLYSAIVDVSKIKNRTKITPTNKISNYVDAVIYEASVRDFTEKADTIKHKGKFLGLVEPNVKTKKGNPLGLDYLKYLGITHLQLLPIVDFRGVSDIYSCDSYNWGYDPISIFSLEGSYSSCPENPTSRLEEFTYMVDELHKNNIRVNMDVVFNHVYEYMSSMFEKVVPNYFFRRKSNGLIADASGCGNDFASERFMARKIIKDALRYFLEVFDVDGFRFDLMGLIDKTTILGAFKELKDIKKDLMFYGEGWDMGYELPKQEKCIIENAKDLKDLAFFNDTFRDIIKGPNGLSGLRVKGYANGDVSYVNGAEYVIAGCTLPYTYAPKYISANQTINYIECHDNFTLMDKLSNSNEDEDLSMIKNRFKLMSMLNILSFGVPFVHMGQEVMLSKNMHGNTYNEKDINAMNWDKVDEHFDNVKLLKDLIEFRNAVGTYSLSDPNEINEHLSFYKLDNGLLTFTVKNKKGGHLGTGFVVIINPTSTTKEYVLDEESQVIFSNCGLTINQKIFHDRGIVGPSSFIIFSK